MTLVRANPAGWALFELLTSGQMNIIDSQMPSALDGTDGGTYVPTASIIIDAALSSGPGLDVRAGPEVGLHTLSEGSAGIHAEVGASPFAEAIHVQVDAGSTGIQVDGTADATGIVVAPGPIAKADPPVDAVSVTGIGNTTASEDGGVGLRVVGGGTDSQTGGRAIFATGGATVSGGAGAATGGDGILSFGGAGISTGGKGGNFFGGTGATGGVGVDGTGAAGSSAAGVAANGGSGGGAGVDASGNQAGAGVLAQGGASNGIGVDATGGGTASGVRGTGGGSNGIGVEGIGDGIGGRFTGGGSSPGVDVVKGGSATNAMEIDGPINMGAATGTDLNPNAPTGISNKVYAKNTIKAWGYVRDGVLVDGFNITSVTIDGSDNFRLNVVIANNMASSEYMIFGSITGSFGSNTPRLVYPITEDATSGTLPTAGTFQLRQEGVQSGSNQTWNDSSAYFMVLGEQS